MIMSMRFSFIRRQNPFDVFIGVLILLVFPACEKKQVSASASPQSAFSSVSHLGDDQRILQAFRDGTSGITVESSGAVEKILPVDLDGIPHQRFIVRLNNGQTLLIAHNIAVAKKIVDLKVGDKVNFKGRYEWNSKGGVVHLTHHDPRGKQPGGWVEHDGKRYE